MATFARDPMLRSMKVASESPVRLVVEFRSGEFEKLRKSCPVAPADYLRLIALKLIELGEPRRTRAPRRVSRS